MLQSCGWHIVEVVSAYHSAVSRCMYKSRRDDASRVTFLIERVVGRVGRRCLVTLASWYPEPSRPNQRRTLTHLFGLIDYQQTERALVATEPTGTFVLWQWLVAACAWSRPFRVPAGIIATWPYMYLCPFILIYPAGSNYSRLFPAFSVCVQS